MHQVTDLVASAELRLYLSELSTNNTDRRNGRSDNLTIPRRLNLKGSDPLL